MAKKHVSDRNFFELVLVTSVIILAAFIFMAFSSRQAPKSVLGSGTGFDQFGYNYTARLFNGPADGVDRTLDGTFWGDATYAKDRLVMKWSPAWDAARFSGAPWSAQAWTDNEWNGRVPGGSGETWHYKIVWVGPALESSPFWKAGGYPIWGEFEVIFSQGTVANRHFWDAHALPSGYGQAK